MTRIVESILETRALTGAVTPVSPAVDVAGQNGISLSIQMVATLFSTAVGATMQLQASNVKVGQGASTTATDWVNVGSSVAISANGSFAVSLDRCPFRYYRIAYALTSGSYTSTLRCLVVGPQ